MKTSGKDKMFVGLQILLFTAYIFEIPIIKFKLSFYFPMLYIFLTGVGVGLIFISMFHLNKNLSPFPTPKEDSKLVTTGIFAFLRHPIYTGILITTFFLAVYLQSGFKLIIVFFLAILFYFKSAFEEKKLLQKFPEYKNYKKHTGRFWPKI